jgi:uncharacterized membrane protein YccC
MLPTLPFTIIASIGVSLMVLGPGWGLLPLLAVGLAVAAAAGGLPYTLAAGAVALAVCLLFAVGMQPGGTHRTTEVAFLAVAGVTAAGALASRASGRRDRELAQVRLVAEAARLCDRYGEDAVFIGPPGAQAVTVTFEWKELAAVTCLASASRTIELIVEQGEGARGRGGRVAGHGRA